MLETRAGVRALGSFLENLDNGALLLDCGNSDFSRIRELVERYRNLPLGFADAAVIACAERRGKRVLTYDQRDFSVVAREGTLYPYYLVLIHRAAGGSFQGGLPRGDRWCERDLVGDRDVDEGWAAVGQPLTDRFPQLA